MSRARDNLVAGALCIGILLACAEGPSLWPQWAALGLFFAALCGMEKS